MQQNEMRLVFDSRSCNESFARVVVAAFMTQLNPTIEEVDDVKTAVSEAVTNAIIHAYGGREGDTGKLCSNVWELCPIGEIRDVREICPMGKTGDIRETSPTSGTDGEKEIRVMPGADGAMELQTMPEGWTDAAGKNNAPKRRQENTEYDLDAADKIEIRCRILGDMLEVVVSDTGCGIADVKQAMEPLFTTRTECDRAGMGFAFMEAFMDTLEVDSVLGKGTRVRMTKRIAREMRKTGAAEDSRGNAEGREGIERRRTNRDGNDTVLKERQESDRWSTPLR